MIGSALVTAGCAQTYSDVRPLYRVSDHRSPAAVEQLYQTGKAHFQAGRYGNALESFKAVLKHNPRSTAALNAIGACYDQLQRFDIAVSFYYRALDLDPDSSKTLNNLGYSLVLQGRREEAAQVLRIALQKSPDDKAVQHNLMLAQPSPHAFAAPVAQALPRDDQTLPTRTRSQPVLTSSPGAIAEASWPMLGGAGVPPVAGAADGRVAMATAYTQPVATHRLDAGYVPLFELLGSAIAGSEGLPPIEAGAMSAAPAMASGAGHRAMVYALLGPIAMTEGTSSQLRGDRSVAAHDGGALLGPGVIDAWVSPTGQPTQYLPFLPVVTPLGAHHMIASSGMIRVSATAVVASNHRPLGMIRVAQQLAQQLAIPVAVRQTPGPALGVDLQSVLGHNVAASRSPFLVDREVPLWTAATGQRFEISNGNGLSGMARLVSEVIARSGGSVTRIANADRFDYVQSAIYYAPGRRAAAERLAARLPIPVIVRPEAVVRRDIDLRLLLGRDFLSHEETISSSRDRRI